MITERLKNWTDIDIAMHELAIELGLVPKNATYSACAYLYWGGKYYEDLKEIIEKLHKLGLLEYSESENQYRTNKNFLQPKI